MKYAPIYLSYLRHEILVKKGVIQQHMNLTSQKITEHNKIKQKIAATFLAKSMNWFKQAKYKEVNKVSFV